MRVRAESSRTASTPAHFRVRRPSRRRILPWLCAVAAVAGAARAADPGDPGGGALLWPTDAGHCVTSSFCEFRSGHFHSGIDISTNGKSGYRVFAVDDGDVVRVRVGCKGYGKAVYLRLKDGRTAVYAHLSAFAGAVEDTARGIGQRTGSAYFDREFAPGTFPFRRGDIVAYSGETGIGVPHLHVEIRDANERPLDPLRAGLRVADRIAPRVARIALSPLSAGSSVDGEVTPRILDARAGDAKRVVPVEGEIGVAIEVSETKDGCRYDLAPAAVGMRDGDRTMSAVAFDRFAFDETGLLDFQIDPRWSYTSRGRFQNLTRPAGYDLPFVAKGADRGVLTGGASGAEERRRIRLFARDSEGNEGGRDLELSFAPPPTLDGLAFAPDPGAASPADSVVVAGRVGAGGRGVARVEVQTSTDGGGTWSEGPPVEPAPDGTIRVAFVRSGPDEGFVVRARPIDRLGVAGIARALGRGSAPPPRPLPASGVRTHGAFWEARLEGVPWASVRVDSSLSGAQVRSLGWGVRVLVPADPDAPGGVPRALARVQDPWGREQAWSVTPPDVASPGRGVRIEAADAAAEVSFLAPTVREPTAVLLRESGRGAHASSELVPLGGLVAVETGAVPLAGDFEIRLAATRPPESAAHVAVFVQDGRSFRYIGGRKEPDGNAWTVRARTALPLGLFEDGTPPKLGVPRLSVAGERVLLTFSVGDRGAGLDCDGIEVLVDGRPVPQELDEERGEVVGYPGFAPTSGTGGAFEIRAIDRCGNAARWSGTLRLP